MKVTHLLVDEPGHTTEDRCPCDPHITTSKPLGQQPAVTIAHRRIASREKP